MSVWTTTPARLLFVPLLIACVQPGDDDPSDRDRGDAAASDGSQGGGASGGGSSLPERLLRCDYESLAQSCTGVEMFSDCVVRECTQAYQQCYGARFAAGDHRGGQCQQYAECLAAAADPCRADCAVSPQCAYCLSGPIVACQLTAACALPSCEAPATGCEGFVACCQQIPNSDPIWETCRATIEAAQGRGEAGDFLCEVYTSNLRGLGYCR